MSNENIERISINAVDSHRQKDKVAGMQDIKDSQRKDFQGMVQIYQRNIGSKKPLYNPLEDPEFKVEDSKEFELVTGKSNLIVYRGRANLLCRAFNKDLIYLSGSPTAQPFYEMKDEYITWFAVGTGGADTTSPMNPQAPNATDYALGSHGDVSGGSRWATINGRQYKRFDENYPQFMPDEEIVNSDAIAAALENVTYGGFKRDQYLISKVRVTLSAAEANTSEGTQNINEAGLFMAASDSYASGYWNSYTKHLNMFSRVTFPTISKLSSRDLLFNWYIYF